MSSTSAVVSPLRVLARFFYFLDDLPGGRPGRRPRGCPACFGRELLAPFQNGLIQFYAAVTALGVAGLLWILLLMK